MKKMISSLLLCTSFLIAPCYASLKPSGESYKGSATTSFNRPQIVNSSLRDVLGVIQDRFEHNVDLLKENNNFQPSFIQRDLDLYSVAQRLCENSSEQNIIDELFVHFSIYEKKDRKCAPMFNSLQRRGYLSEAERSSLFEYDYYAFIVNALRSQASMKAIYFDNHMILGSNGEIQFSTEVKNKEKFNENFMQYALSSMSEAEANDLLLDHCTYLCLKNNVVERLTSRNFNDPLLRITRFYRDAAQSLYELNNFYIAQNFKISQKLLAKPTKESYVAAISGMFSSVLNGGDVGQAFGNIMALTDANTTTSAAVEELSDKDALVDAAAKKKKKKNNKNKKKRPSDSSKVVASEAEGFEQTVSEDHVDDASVKDTVEDSFVMVDSAVIDSAVDDLSESVSHVKAENDQVNSTPQPVPAVNVKEEGQMKPTETEEVPLTKAQKRALKKQLTAEATAAEALAFQDLIDDFAHEKMEPVTVSEKETAFKSNWYEQLRTANELKFSDFTALLKRELSSLNAKLVEQGGKFIFFFDSPTTAERVAVTGDMPHGSQNKKGWPAWRHAFKKKLEAHNVGMI